MIAGSGMENIPHQWKPEYELGSEAIDHQHRYLFDLSLRLSREIERSDNLLYRKSLVEELSAYAHFHMRSEENMMQREEYPELGAHKLLHRQLIDILSSKTSKFYLTPSSRHWHEMMVFFLDVFFRHATRDDWMFAQYLVKKSGLKENR